MFINVQTGEAFVTAEETYVVENEISKKAWKLTREDGTKKTVSDVAFTAWYREDHERENQEAAASEKQSQTQPSKKPQLTHHQKVAKKQLEHAYNWIIGGHENSLSDGHIEELPSVEDMFTEVYDEATSCLYGEGCVHTAQPAPASMSFAGKKFLLQTLADLFKADGYEVPEELLKVPEKKKGTSREYKDTPDSVGEDEVVMRAFTGMLIGVFKIVKQTKTHIMVEIANGSVLKFNKKTGIQADAKNPKFANRIEI